jgi:predicted negative regulator of RcsB-dependent stress response
MAACALHAIVRPLSLDHSTSPQGKTMALAASKHDIRRNPLAEWVTAVIQFIQARRALVAGVALALILAAGATAGYLWYQGKQEAQARKVLAEAQGALRPEAPGPEGKPVEPKTDEALKLLQQVADRYAGTPSAEEAVIRLGNIEASRGKREAASEHYGRYLREYPRGRFAMMAVIGRAYSLETGGDLDGAAKTLAAGLDRHAQNPLAGEAYTALARIHEQQKNVEAATKLYNQIVEKFPGTRWAQHAASRLDAIKPK